MAEDWRQAFLGKGWRPNISRPVEAVRRLSRSLYREYRRTIADHHQHPPPEQPAAVMAAAALRAHRARQLQARLKAGSSWSDQDFVFTSSVGTPMDPRNVTRLFKALLKVAALPDIRLHDLRHSCATLLLVQNVSPRVVMETLGHSQISLTLNTYSHVLPQMQHEAAAKLDALLTGS